MHFFGTLGLFSFLAGTIITLWIIAQKLYHIYAHVQYTRDVTEQPLFYIALTAVIIGSQLFLTGFIAELVSRSAPDRNAYHIEKTV
jgi:hypothetical protein